VDYHAGVVASVPLTVKPLGERLYLGSGTLTPQLKRLQEKDLVLRRRVEHNSGYGKYPLPMRVRRCNAELERYPKSPLANWMFVATTPCF